MLQYESDDTYSFYLASGEKIFLTENDISEIIKERHGLEIIEDFYNREIIDIHSSAFIPISKRARPYHSKEHIIELVDRYYDKSNNALNTKRKVFVRVANELNITPKAVNKAYYSK